MRRRPLSLALPALALSPWHRAGQAQTPPSAAPEGGRSGGAPAFDGLAARLPVEFPDVQSVSVVRRGRVLFDYGTAGPDTLHDVQSVTKSVLSLAVGAALGRGAIDSLDRPVHTLPGLREPVRAAEGAVPFTLRHLLTMTAGFRPQARFAPGTADDAAFLLGRERVAAPGTVFAYDNLSANLLAIALEAATGQSVPAFAEQALFGPLGIGAHDWARGTHGHALGFSGLRLRTRDMARLGELALNAGAWAGRSLVPEAFVRSAVAPQNAGGPPVGLAYGYLWWVVPAAAAPRTFLAVGWGGQFIWVHPPLDLVIATTSVVSAEANRRGQALALLRGPLFRAAEATPG